MIPVTDGVVTKVSRAQADSGPWGPSRQSSLSRSGLLSRLGTPAISLGELGSWLPKIDDALREGLTARGLPGWVEPGVCGLGRQPAVYGLVDSLGGLAFAYLPTGPWDGLAHRDPREVFRGVERVPTSAVRAAVRKLFPNAPSSASGASPSSARLLAGVFLEPSLDLSAS